MDENLSWDRWHTDAVSFSFLSVFIGGDVLAVFSFQDLLTLLTLGISCLESFSLFSSNTHIKALDKKLPNILSLWYQKNALNCLNILVRMSAVYGLMLTHKVECITVTVTVLCETVQGQLIWFDCVDHCILSLPHSSVIHCETVS